MPLLGLLTRRSKRISRKLGSKSADTSTTPDTIQRPHRSVSEGAGGPSLFPVQSPKSNSDELRRIPTPPAKTPDTTSELQSKAKEQDDESKANPKAVTTLPPTPPPSDGDTAPNDLSERLKGPWKEVHKEQKMSKVDKLFQRMEVAAQSPQSDTVAVSAAAVSILDAMGGTDAIEQGISHILGGSDVLMKALDQVQGLHPFIGVAVVAFKAVYTLEMKRRDNDKRITALHGEMRDMMIVLLQLKNVKDPKVVGPGGLTIEDRMKTLVDETAKLIEDCANDCDTYCKKKIIVKVVQGPVWNNYLVAYAGQFAKHRSQFEYALSIHTSLGVDAANEKLDDVGKTTQEMNAKMDQMLEMFKTFMSPQEKEVKKLVDEKGGPEACEADDQLIQELNEFEQTRGSPQGGKVQAGRKAGVKLYSFEDLKEDLQTSPEQAVKKNKLVFERKLEIQKRQIAEEMDRIAKREADRVIRSVNAGPHDKINDPDVRKIWKEMRWPGSVKTRHFVMAVRDYYQENRDSDDDTDDQEASEQPSTKPRSTIAGNRQSDQWARAYISVLNLQPIAEAFDDDGSGFVTVAEVNTFTSLKPSNWSLARWIAYWAIGWHQSMATYASKIRDIIAKMFAILPRLYLANRGAANEYLLSIYEDVMTLESSLTQCFVNETLQEKFKEYVDGEEDRLRRNLEAVEYDIDAPDTLSLITGPGRIGRFVFPLLYLILKRHFEIFRVCQWRVIHPDELPDATGTVGFVSEAVRNRVEVLESSFSQQRVDIQQHFKTFSHGLYNYFNDPSGLWDPEIIRKAQFPDYPYDDSMEDPNIKADKILSIKTFQELDLAAYDPLAQQVTELDGGISAPLGAVVGRWNGFIYRRGLPPLPGGRMISMYLRPSSSEDQRLRFEASEQGSAAAFTVSGECSLEETTGSIKVTFSRKFNIRRLPQYFNGELDATTETIGGTCGNEHDSATHRATFIFKRMAPEYLRFLPAPATFEENRTRALWSFALSAVREVSRQQSWSWSFFSKRRDTRKRFIELHLRNTEFGCPLDPTESEELRELRQSLTTADSRFYSSLARYQARRTTRHSERCANCRGKIGGARIICLVCRPSYTWSVDLCEATNCAGARIESSDQATPHLPTHDVIKVRRIVHVRQVGQMERAAEQALRRAREAFVERRIPDPVAYDCDDASPVVEVIQKPRSTEKVDRKVCIFCKVGVTLKKPCWYCIQCQDHTFICDHCNAKGGRNLHEHKDTHDLVKCQEQEASEISAEPSLEDRLASLERGLVRLGSKVDQRWSQFESKVDNRMERFERMLESSLGQEGVELSRSVRS